MAAYAQEGLDPRRTATTVKSGQGTISRALLRLTPAQRFMLASLVVLISGMAGVGWWIAWQIKAGVVNHTGYTIALYVDSFIAPPLQELASSSDLSPQTVTQLERMLTGTVLGQEVIAFKVWGPGGRIIYSPEADLIGRSFPVGSDLKAAWEGQVVANISDLEDAENVQERLQARQLLEIYSPVRAAGRGDVIGVVEFYQRVDDLEGLVLAAQQRSWLIIAAVTFGMYVLLSGFVQRSSDTIVRQQAELRSQVTRLTEVFTQNEELHERVRRAAARNTELNERFLRRVSAELHDGPAQYLGLALLRIDQVATVCESLDAPNLVEDLEMIQIALSQAMQEVRGISAGLGLPEIEGLNVSELVGRVVRAHERRTITHVQVELVDVPERLAEATRITLYRVIQEALSNAFHHAGGAGQRVELRGADEWIQLRVIDRGPGFAPPTKARWGEHMGLAGMRERVESLSGEFAIDSRPDEGTAICVRLPCQPAMELL